MVRIILIFLISYAFFCPQLHAQKDSVEWAPLGATWYYSYEYYATPRVDYLKMESTKDTLVNGQNARLIEGTIYTESGYIIPATEKYEDGSFIIHQNGDSIFYLRENKFELLYDFSLEAGDTMDVVTPGPYRPRYDNDTMIQITIDSIGEVVLHGDTLRKQVVSMNWEKYNDTYIFQGEIIEKVGIELFFLPFDDLVCDLSCPGQLRCYQDSTVFYKRVEMACDTTYLPTPTENLPGKPEIRLYPNPVTSGAAQVHIEGPDRFTWKLRDIHGRILYQSAQEEFGKISASLPAGLCSGIYLVEIQSNEKIYIKKLIVR